ncbi:MAG: SpoIIE family protein phosphatase [Desulfobacterales bacterium]|nr:MAG: SpoIIE family protein phosphatase [Desulfobacterales bacterium]
MLRILTDSSQPTQERVKAAEMIGDIGELETIEPIWNLKFGAFDSSTKTLTYCNAGHQPPLVAQTQEQRRVRR